MAKTFGFLKELTTSRTQEKVLVREKARHPITKNVNAISLVKMKKEKNIENNEVVDQNVIKLSELNAIERKEVTDMKKEVEDETNDELVRSVEEETMGDGIKELVDIPRLQPVGYYLKHEINKKLIEGLIGRKAYLIEDKQIPSVRVFDKVSFYTFLRRSKEVTRQKQEVSVTLYNALHRKEYERVFMCRTAKEVWHTLIITSQGNSQVKDRKIDLLTQQYEKFSISSEETMDNSFTRFNVIVTTPKYFDHDYSSKNHVRNNVVFHGPLRKRNVQKGQSMTKLLLLKKMELELKAAEREIHRMDQCHKDKALYLWTNDEELMPVLKARWNIPF
uniref:UBN2 domain-containing protein n=1 Tax=Tanacetum cinerariifolium TaxID=118510 RepID=A0A6L2JC00_TANCI|nr:UBN2 domain-containing protein [Tanacetum cinerariifolium]